MFDDVCFEREEGDSDCLFAARFTPPLPSLDSRCEVCP